MRSSAVLKSAPGLDIYESNMAMDIQSILPLGCSNEQCGTVLRFERSSVHDGDGFRTVVFLKGCPLRCLWCSTPESQSPVIECTQDKIYGETMSVDEVMAEIRKDSVFYFHSGGGLTISGGEPLSQIDFTESLLKKACFEGINTTIETSLYAPYKSVERILPYLNTMYADIKHIDPEEHKRICGVDNACILSNIRKVDAQAKSMRLILRLPVIPGINDDPETLHAIGAFCKELKNLYCIQLLPYHRLGTDTYRKLGLDYPLADVMPPSDEHMENCRAIVRSYTGGAC